MGAVRLVMAAFVLASVVFSAPEAYGTTEGTKHYPDLRTLAPSDLNISHDCSLFGSCTKLLRFSNTVWNAGDGRLELRPQNDAASGKTTAYQRVWTHDVAGRWSLAEELDVGQFVFHSAHNHWHFEGFANYSLVNVNADGSIGTNVRRSSQKTTFCLIDTQKVDGGLEHSGAQTYKRCGQTDTTGITVGWGDEYGYYLDGQSFDITNLRNGRYWLVSTADHQDRLHETDNSNNWAAVKIRIRDNSVKVLETKLPT